MLSRVGARLARLAARPALRSSIAPPQCRPAAGAVLPSFSVQSRCPREFHSSTARSKGLQPDSENPKAPNTQSAPVAGAAAHITEPSPLTPEEYHDYSEHYFNVLIADLEKAQEDGSEVEAEYSAGVLNISVPSVGTYVLNKQPPNKQIWLSSPVTGPKRYDWVLEGDRMHEKQDTREFAHGQWIYLRDGSNLTDLLNTELKLELPRDIYGRILE